MDVVIVAGGPLDPEFADAAGVATRGELPVNGQAMLDVVLGALSPIGEPIVMGGPLRPGLRQYPPGRHFIDSVRIGLGRVRSPRFLLSAVDLPALTEASVRDFLHRSDPQAGFNYPVIPVAACERRFPGMKRTVLRLREGVFTGGNLALIDTAAMHRTLPILERAYAVRKRPLRLAGLVGWGTVGRVMLGRFAPRTLPIASLEAAVGAFLQMRVNAVASDYAEIGADVDNLEQYRAFLALKNTA